jgi:hypothetical protein
VESPDVTINKLNELFGNYRAEWLHGRIFKLYTQPAYFPQLETLGPCILVGGRGTGKTTVLRCLSYEGQFALANEDVNYIASMPYYGFYYRADTNRVTAFRGPELRRETWIKLFAHYINILLCDQVLQFLRWYAERCPNDPMLARHDCNNIAISLHLMPSSTTQELLDNLNLSRLHFEAYLNNLNEDRVPPLSLQSAPISELINATVRLPQFRNKYFLFLIDEYENLLDDQQMIINTLIKHSGEKYTFKIGVRELGLRVRATMNPNEQLKSPADYVRINIAETLSGPAFKSFAHEICNQRINQLRADARPLNIDSLLPGLTDDEEAELLGVAELNRQRMQREALDVGIIKDISPLELYFACVWADAQGKSLHETLSERRANRKTWKTRYENYKFAMLFTIREGKVGIRKYYCGWDTFIQLSGGNIRFLLQLVDQTLLLAHRAGASIEKPVSPEIQTRSAEAVGKKNVGELEGNIQGAQLTRLVLGLGRVFEVMARQPAGHTPEVSQFAISDGVPEDAREFEELMTSAVMHLALVRVISTKRGDETDLKSYDYGLPPIYAPFFGFSYRKKRKMKLRAAQIVSLTGPDAKETIRDILRENRRVMTDDLPAQLMLFGKYYGLNT